MKRAKNSRRTALPIVALVGASEIVPAEMSFNPPTKASDWGSIDLQNFRSQQLLPATGLAPGVGQPSFWRSLYLSSRHLLGRSF